MIEPKKSKSVRLKRRLPVVQYGCHRCGAWFSPRREPVPGKMGRCSRCKSPYWNVPRSRARPSVPAAVDIQPDQTEGVQP